MSSLFSANPRPAHTRPRARSHGGLGGLVKPDVVLSNGEKTISDWGSWPKRGRKRPPPLPMSLGEDKLLVPLTPRSAQSFQINDNLSGTPKAPASVGWSCPQTGVQHVSPLVSRFNPAGSRSLPRTGPVPLPNTRLPSKAQPIELPGSLLLPSQGFPPPPATPPRPVHLRRRDTDESDLSPPPSLSTSISTASPSDSMDLLRGLSHTHWKPAANGVSSSGSAKKQSGVSKSFSAMSIEELLASLPACDSATAARVWLPEMQKKCSTIKDRLQKVENTRLTSDVKVNWMSNDLKSFMQEVRAISNTYESILRSAEALLERDTHTLRDRLQVTETQLKKAHIQIQDLDALLLEKVETISRLDHTISETVRILGTFIQRNVAQWVNEFYKSETQGVMQIISDYGQTPKDNQVRYLRVPESNHIDLLSSLRRAEEDARSYRTVTEDQDMIIKDQSKQLDQQLSKYEQTLKTIEARDHEVTLLGQRNMELEARVEAYETALRRSHAVVVECDGFRKENEELRREIKQVSGFFKLQLDEKDTKLADLRQKLGSAREEALARRADVRNVITQTQAILAPQSQGGNGDSSRKGSSGKSPKLFARLTGKTQMSPRVPLSPSNMSLGFSPLNPDLLTSPNLNPDSKYSSKEAISCNKGQFVVECGSSGSSVVMNSSTHTPGQRGSEDPFSDGVTVRPNGKGNAAGDVYKILPAVPPALLPPIPKPSTLLNSQLLASPSPQISISSSPVNSLSPSPSLLPPLHSNGMRSPKAHRVLSLIPEASAEDSGSLRAPSATSSDREVYRRSILALDVLNSSSTEGLLPAQDDGDEESMAGSARGTVRVCGDESGMGSVSSSEEALSEVLTVSQLYHGAGGMGHVTG